MQPTSGFACGLCPPPRRQVFATRDARFQHVMDVHPEQPNSTPDDGQRDGSYPCGIGHCDRTFSAKQSRGQHRRKAHPGWRQQVVLAADEPPKHPSAGPSSTEAHAPLAHEKSAQNVPAMCSCDHAARMHERDELADTGRGVCFHSRCGCSVYQPKPA